MSSTDTMMNAGAAVLMSIVESFVVQDEGIVCADTADAAGLTGTITQ